MFIKQTTLRRVSDRASVLTVAGIIRTLDEMFAFLPEALRPAADQVGDYTLEYDLACVYELRVKGEIEANGLLVIEYDIWTDEASKNAGDPPALSNTHIFGLSNKPGADHKTMIAYHVQQFIIRAALADWTGNQRETRLGALKTTDLATKYADVLTLEGVRVRT